MIMQNNQSQQIPDNSQKIQSTIQQFQDYFAIYESVFPYLPIKDTEKSSIEKRKDWISKLKQTEFHVAFLGSYSAGKSTIINLLNRFYEINSGTISIDGRNINEFELKSLRKQIAVVLQDVFLFADTILNNITLDNPNITREDVIEAAQKIGVHEFIMTLPNGYDYNVKERGVMLSSGQRQLIAFLRAYVSNPSILILDEATSSIDTYSEELIQRATEKITKGRTSIVIAHRLATVVNADKIIVMDKGKIVEQGKHAELLLNEKGFYKNLYDSQFVTEH